MDRIKELILKHIRLEISEQEEIELQAWLNKSERNRQLFIEIMNPEELSKSFRKLDNLHKSEVWERIKDYSENHDLPLHKELVTTFGSRPLGMISGNRKWWAAAAVLIGVSFGTYFLVRNQKITQPAVAVVPSKTDVAPGGNRAVLTLGNGSKIILDSAQDGIIAKQGNTNIVKTDSGKLAYKTSSDITPALSYNTMTTPRGGQYELVLSDGTKVWMNAASSITYPTAFVGKERKVTITGEVYFEVIHIDKQPFIVSVNGLEIEDIGTHFNINAYPDENSINTTLIEGSVKIKLDKKEKLLYPGQEAQLSSDGKLTIDRNADIKKIMAWKNGQFRFDGDDLESAMRQISRWYDVDVVNENVKGAHLTGVISRNVNVSEVFKMLELTGVVHFKIEGKTVTVEKVN